MNHKLPNAFQSLALILGLGYAIFGCSKSEQTAIEANNRKILGSYQAFYDASTQNVSVARQGSGKESELDRQVARALTIGDNSTGALFCAILDNDKAVNETDYCMGLVDPDSCSVDFNAVTKVLSFYFKLENKSDIPDDLNDGVGFDYTDKANFPPNTTFLNPFYFILTGIQPAGSAPNDLVQSVNTNLSGAACGSNGLSLNDSNDDNNGDGRFDCIFPEYQSGGPYAEYDFNKSDYPGWDFSPHVPGGALAPGESTDCGVFAQFTLKENQSFILYFDVVGVMDDGSIPNNVEVTSPTSGSFTNANTITVEGNNNGTSCDPAGEVFVEGGISTVSSACSVSGTFSVTVTLKQNQTNTLNIYQVVTSKQSGAETLSIIHDNIPPTIVSSSPNDGETSVDRNVNCAIQFSEPMDTAGFSTGSNCSNGSFSLCQGASFLAGSISFSQSDTVATLIPNGKPLNQNALHSCTVRSTVADLAGNTLASTVNIDFTTVPGGSEFEDTIPPYVRYTSPPDNSIVSPNSAVVVYFNEAIDPATVNVVDPICSTDGIPNIAVYEFTGNCATSGVVPGNFQLNGGGDIATFVPTAGALNASSSFMLTVQGCVDDLSGNSLPIRQTLLACGDLLNYNILNLFETNAGGDATAPELVHVGPVLNVNQVSQAVHPFMVFSEPLSPATVVPSNFFITKFGNPAPIPLNISLDPTLQVVNFELAQTLNATTTATHVLTATGSVADLAGNSMLAPQTSQFDVSGSPDNTPPSVLDVIPSNDYGASAPSACGSAGNYVSKCSSFDIYFSKPMDASTLNTANIELINVAGSPCSETMKKPVSIEVADNAQHVRITPVSSMRSGGACGGDRRRYYVQIRNVTDRSGNPMANPFQSLIYSACGESDVPSVLEIVPASGNPLTSNGSIAVFFSEEMDKTTLTATNFTYSSCLPTITAGGDGKSAVVNCTFNTAGAGTLTVNREVKDFYNNTNNASCESDVGNRMAANVTASYTAGGLDTTPPTIINLSDVTPQDQSSGVALSASASVTFSEALDPRTVLPSAIFLTDQRGNQVVTRLSISNAGRTITLTPVANLENDEVYYMIATTALRDLGGGLTYDGAGGEVNEIDNVLRSCFATGNASCP